MFDVIATYNERSDIDLLAAHLDGRVGNKSGARHEPDANLYLLRWSLGEPWSSDGHAMSSSGIPLFSCTLSTSPARIP